MICCFIICFSKGNHAVAIIKTSEDYDILEHSLSNISRDVNEMIEKGYIDVDGNRVQVEFFLGGDYKVNLCGVNDLIHHTDMI